MENEPKKPNSQEIQDEQWENEEEQNQKEIISQIISDKDPIYLSEIQVPPRTISVQEPTYLDHTGVAKEQYYSSEDIYFLQKLNQLTHAPNPRKSLHYQQQEIKKERRMSIKDKLVEQFSRKVDWSQQADRYVAFNEQTPSKYKNNTIQTTKYTPLNFIPLNLFEQFRRFSNFYFLIMGILEMVPQITTTDCVPVLYFPLFFIIVITGIKDYLEDRKRFKSDKNENELIILKAKNRAQIFQQQYENQQQQNPDSKRHKLGNNLHSSSINTDPISTTLPPFQERQSFPLMKNQTIKNQSQFRNQLPITHEDHSLYEETQSQHLQVGNIVKIKQNQPIPADLILLYTSNRNGLAYLETKNLDGETNLKIKAPPKKFLQMYQSEYHCSTKEATLLYEHPNPFLYKFQGVVQHEQDQNQEEEEDQDQDQDQEDENTTSLNQDHLLLRGCTLKNTKFIIGIVCYTGHETKVLLNANNPRSKRSKVEVTMNKYILYIITIQVTLCLFASIFNIIWYDEKDSQFSHYLATDKDPKLSNPFYHFIISLGTWILLLMNLIPISLLLTLDFVRVIQSIALTRHKSMVSKEGIKAGVQCSNLNEDLGQINCIFSDKTGTLTCNEMNFKCIWFNKNLKFGKYKEQIDPNDSYLPSDNDCIILDSAQSSKFKEKENNQENHQKTQSLCQKPVQNVNFEDNFFLNLIEKINLDPKNNEKNSQIIIDSLICLAGCHSILIDEESGDYQASSPDELALLNFAKYSGYEFKGINITNILTIYNHITNQNLQYKLEYVLDFTSDRKRMSIIARDLQNTKSIYLFSKGADNIMLKRLKNKQNIPEIQAALDSYASEGLRTLVIAKKQLNREELQEFHVKITKASQEFQEREEKMEAVMDEIEQDLEFLCATAIEDRLQDEVQDTIESLKKTGLGFWILTGDKLETAISIGYSTKVITENDEIFLLNEQNFNEIDLENLKNKPKKQILVVQGDLLSHIFESEAHMKTFSQITALVHQVIACRVSPKQKKEIVHQYKLCHPNERVIAIGDGANDVNMINEAHIGIGIKGKEGVQAARASDFSIGEFKLLKPLLLYFGREYYRKNTIVINYNFYKNFLYLFPNLWFGLVSGFSGANFYDIYLFQLYNACYCALPIMFFAALDKQFSKKLLMKNPIFYKTGLNNIMFNNKVLAYWLLQAIIHAAIITFFSIYATNCLQLNQPSQINIDTLGQIIFLLTILVSNFKVLIEHNFQILGCVIINALSSLFYVLNLGIASSSVDYSLFDTFQQMVSGLYFWFVLVLVLALVSLSDHAIHKYNKIMEYKKMQNKYDLYKSKIAERRSRRILSQQSQQSQQEGVFNIENNNNQKIIFDLQEPLLTQDS